MATHTLTRPAGFREPKQLVRLGLVIAVLMVTGIGVGMAIDSGRAGVPVQAQAASTDVAAAEIPSLASFDLSNVFYDPLASRATFGGVPIEGHYSPELSTWIFGAATVVGEHGAFTPMAYRDPAVIQERFAGGDAILDPDVLPIAGLGEHGAFTPMAYRNPAVIEQRFVGTDANLDPDAPTGPTAVYDTRTSSLVPAGGGSQGAYDTETSRWVE